MKQYSVLYSLVLSSIPESNTVPAQDLIFNFTKIMACVQEAWKSMPEHC